MSLWVLQHFSSFGESRRDASSGVLTVKQKTAQSVRLGASEVSV